jgi:hypothetical protein
MAASAKATLKAGGSVMVADVRKAFPSARLSIIAKELLQTTPAYIPVFLAQYSKPYKSFAMGAGVVQAFDDGLVTADADSRSTERGTGADRSNCGCRGSRVSLSHPCARRGAVYQPR